jgi:putative cell wall-binding protein
MIKNFLIGTASVFFILFFGAGSSFAQTTYENPPPEQINKLLTEAALKYNVPPEIVKAIAYNESYGWKQFDNGAPLITGDNGIGIMQVTNDPRFDQDRLKTDISYNIDAGVQILSEKFNEGTAKRLPILNNNERNILENWYFAVLAYNGQVQKNSPIYMADGSRNTGSYEDKIYQSIDDFNVGMGISPIPFDFKTSDFTYSNPSLLTFNTLSYTIPYHLLHPTKYLFQMNDMVLSAAGANLRQGPSSSSSSIEKIPAGEKETATVLAPFVYDQTNVYKSSVDMTNYQSVWYNVKLPDGKVGYLNSSELMPIGKRISGETRYETAVAISKEGWPNGADTVVLARGYDFPDALAGTTLAYHLNAPMLLTNEQNLTDTTKAEIQRLNAKKVILLGSDNAISGNVENQLTSLGLTVQRIGGTDRFDTADQIADNLPNKGNTAIVAFGYDFPDALTVAPYAAKMGYPIFLSRTDDLSSATKDALKNFDHTIVVGSENAISDSVMAQLNDPVRYGGSTRFDTNDIIVNNLFDGANGKAYLATGYNFADALTGAVLAAKNNAPLLLSYPTQVPDSIQNAIMTKKLHDFDFLGGNDVLGVDNQIGSIFQNVDY